jgi:hypothetical protein
MRKSTTYYYAEGDVRQIIRDELKVAKKEIASEVTKRVTDDVTLNVTKSVTRNVTENVTEVFVEKIKEFKNEIFDLLDKVMGELKAIREEQTVISSYKDQIENHETRLGKVEETLNL